MTAGADRLYEEIAVTVRLLEAVRSGAGRGDGRGDPAVHATLPVV